MSFNAQRLAGERNQQQNASAASQARSPPKVEDTEMCDYSLHGVHSRPAKVNDRLVTTQFRNTITSGFSEIGKSHVAVCLLPGTEICFDQEVERAPTVLQFFLFRRSTRIISYKVARFRQVNMNNLCTHHDALEFPDGQIVLLTHLRPGQRATVLQLPVQQKPPVIVQPRVANLDDEFEQERDAHQTERTRR